MTIPFDERQQLPADRDLEFLANEDNRGIRLQLDYEKTEQALSALNIKHTLVIFGSTRVIERPQAEERLSIAESAHAKQPDDETLQLKLRQARHLLSLAHYYDEARRLARLAKTSACALDGSCLAVMTGGGPGIMEAANRGAFESQIQSIGLNITLPHEQFANPYLSPGLGFGFHYFAMRKFHFFKRACALVAFPGGFGTLDELFEALTLIQTGKMAAMPVVLVGKDYWRRIVNFEALVEFGTIEAKDLNLLAFAETAEETWDLVLNWHQRHQTSYFNNFLKSPI